MRQEPPLPTLPALALGPLPSFSLAGSLLYSLMCGGSRAEVQSVHSNPLLDAPQVAPRLRAFFTRLFFVFQGTRQAGRAVFSFFPFASLLALYFVSPSARAVFVFEYDALCCGQELPVVPPAILPRV